MTDARNIPPAALAPQIAAANPERSVFVSANAGSGKTHVLVQRVINLLLRGIDPAKILCITFTKAAAANMANRVFATLAEWTALDDAELDKKIAAGAGKPPTAAQRQRARRLFATALETPGGLKVQTIHAFCTRLLHQFPFEADVAARFEVLDDASTSQMLDELTLDVMLDAARDPDGPLGRALASAITAAADLTFKEVIREAIGKHDLVTSWIGRAGGVQQAIDELSRMFDLDPADTIEKVEAEYFSGSPIPESEWPAIIEALSAGGKTDQKHAERLTACRAATGRDRIECYLDIFCTDARGPRSSIVTKAVANDNPELAKNLVCEQERVCGLLKTERALRARDRSAALLTVAAAVIERYRREKERRGALDYDDLIDKTLALFESATAAWVLYKLDLGIDHLLIDEAQDTSPKQWQVIRTLSAEFLPGGARENVKRTLFAVGDEKQSIFSFQGADPRAFAANRRYFETIFKDSEASFCEERLEYSFRSSPVVLEAVDAVFARDEALRGLSDDAVKTVHQAVYDEAPGEVEIWPLIEPDEKDKDKEGWDAPFDTTRETSPAIKLAARIGRTVKRWRAQGTRPGDVLILVRQRGPLFEAVIRALKGEGIPVAGADRLTLTEHIAVMDLLVLGDALLLPQDDLALATVLKSPPFGLDDEQLFVLAHGRKGSLRGALREKAADDPRFAAAAERLDDLAAAARSLPPFAFYARVLGALGGRKRFLERLGIEANDPLDEFLNLALDYERRDTPSLQGFLHWVRAAQSEIKRDMEMDRDEVRVMTVHGAKGLEAKTVILIDGTTTRPEGAHPPRLLIAPVGGAPPGAEAVIWGAAKDKDVGPMADARARAVAAATDEYRRLLYVGMTRAAERLVVCGTKGVHKCPDDCWHRLVSDALVPLSVEADDGEGPLWRFTKAPLVTAIADEANKDGAPAPLPAWLTAKLAPQPQVRRRIRPSDADERSEPSSAAGAGQRDKARRRGTLMHRLLQSLPDIAPEKRAAVAQVFLGRDSEFTAAEHADMAMQALRILGDSRFAHLFLPGSRAEVSLTGVALPVGAVPVAGQVDRLALTETEVLIADYKTNRPAPKRIADVPPAYVQQLALYRALLGSLYPGRIVRSALIWTEVPDLMELSTEDMDQALMRITHA